MGLLGVVLLGVILAIGEATDAVTGVDRAVTDAAADLRTPTLVDVAKAMDLLIAVPSIMVLRWGTVLALAVLGRFRHLVVFLATFVVTDWVVARALHVTLEPPDVTVLAEAGTYAFPSLSLAALAITWSASCSCSCRGGPLGGPPRGSCMRPPRGRRGRADPGDGLPHPDGLLVVVRYRPRRCGLPNVRSGGRVR